MTSQLGSNLKKKVESLSVSFCTVLSLLESLTALKSLKPCKEMDTLHLYSFIQGFSLFLAELGPKTGFLR